MYLLRPVCIHDKSHDFRLIMALNSVYILNGVGILWAIAYTCPAAMSLPKLAGDAASGDTAELEAWRLMFARMQHCWVALDLIAFAEELLERAGHDGGE